MDWREAKIGAHIGPGWEPIVDALHARVLEIDPDVLVEQVKEKFGGLRYYYHSEFPWNSAKRREIEIAIERAEALAESTCEGCGQPGTNESNVRGWAKTLCPSCLDRSNAGERVT